MGDATLRWLFAGQGRMGAAALAALCANRRPVAVLTQEPPLGAQAVAEVAEAHELALHRVDRLGPDPATRWPQVFARLDAAVACCWTERLGADALQAPAYGWFNLHPSALPAWRGADPIAWQLLTAPARIGCTVHRMTEHLDDGPVVARTAVPVGGEDDRAALLRRAGERLGGLAAGLLDALAAGTAPPGQPQDADGATWCPPPGTVPLVDPNILHAADGARVARAFSPQPGIALTVLPARERFAFVEEGPPLVPSEVSGTVVPTGDGCVDIAFADGWLRGRVGSPPPDLAAW